MPMAASSVRRSAAGLKIVPFVTRKSWIEDAYQHQVLVGTATQIVFVVIVENVYAARPQRVDIALHIFDFASARNAVTGLEVASVLQPRLGPGAHHGVTYGEAHPIAHGQKAMAGAVPPINVSIRLFDVVQVAYEHVIPRLNSKSVI
jgi:hypothetical protein